MLQFETLLSWPVPVCHPISHFCHSGSFSDSSVLIGCYAEIRHCGVSSILLLSTVTRRPILCFLHSGPLEHLPSQLDSCSPGDSYSPFEAGSMLWRLVCCICNPLWVQNHLKRHLIAWSRKWEVLISQILDPHWRILSRAHSQFVFQTCSFTLSFPLFHFVMCAHAHKDLLRYNLFHKCKW